MLAINYSAPSGHYYSNLFDSNQNVWNSGTNAFESYDSLNEQMYGIELLPDINRYGFYTKSITFTNTSGTFISEIFSKTGNEFQRTSDYLLGVNKFFWDGSREIDIPDIDAHTKNLQFSDGKVNANIDQTNILAIKTKTDQLQFNNGVVCTVSGQVVLTSGSINDFFNSTIESDFTFIDVLRLISSTLLGYRSGGGTSSISFKGIDGITTRVTMTQDSNGNSTSNPVLNPD